MKQKPPLAKLKKLWYKKLKVKGFKDIEDANGRLINWSSSKTVTQDKTTEEYYRLASQMIWSGKFNTKQERTIWTYHSDGVKAKEIAGLTSTSLRTVYRRIRTIRVRFGLI